MDCIIPSTDELGGLYLGGLDAALNIELLKNDFPKEYWQIVSNCCIDDVEIGEAITYMPYVSEYEEIRDMAENYDGADAWKYKFIRDLPVEDLPFLPDGGYYKNINKFAFIVPKEDKDHLEERIKQAEEKLKSLNQIS